MTTAGPGDQQIAIRVPNFLASYVTDPIETGVQSLSPLQIIKVDTLGIHFKQDFIFETAKIIARQAQNQLERACRKYIEVEVARELDRLSKINEQAAAAGEPALTE